MAQAEKNGLLFIQGEVWGRTGRLISMSPGPPLGLTSYTSNGKFVKEVTFDKWQIYRFRATKQVSRCSMNDLDKKSSTAVNEEKNTLNSGKIKNKKANIKVKALQYKVAKDKKCKPRPTFLKNYFKQNVLKVT